MRAYEILREYNRDSTINSLGTKILKTYYSSKYGNRVPEYLLTDPSVRRNVLNEIFNVLESFKVPYVPDNYYTVWLAREYSNENLFKNVGNGISTSNDMNYLKSNLEVLKPYLESYYRYKNKPWFPSELKDIMKLDRDTFVDGMRSLKVPEQVTKDRGQFKIVLENDDLRIIHLLDKQAAIYYGQGTNPRWCTSYTTSDNRFDDYNRRGPLYVLLPKNSIRVGEKYQMHFDRSKMSYDEYTDETNTRVNPYTLYERFGQPFLEWLYDMKPLYRDSIMFQPDDTVKRLYDSLSDYIKPQFEKYASELNEPNIDPEIYNKAYKFVMDSWEYTSNVSVSRIKKAAVMLYDVDTSIYEMTNMYDIWEKIFDDYMNTKAVSLSLTKILDYIPRIEKVGSDHYRKQLGRIFYRDIEVDGYYIGTLGGHIR